MKNHKSYFLNNRVNYPLSFKSKEIMEKSW